MPNHSARTRNDQPSAGRAPAGQSSIKEEFYKKTPLMGFLKSQSPCQGGSFWNNLGGFGDLYRNFLNLFVFFSNNETC